jgi:ribosomal protein S12 methylthiotransferase accessory factor
VRRLPVGWGKGFTAAAAVRSAFGEAIERYSASLPDISRITWRRLDELEGDVLDPRAFPLYDDEQYARPGFPYARFDPTVPHPWVRGSRLESGDDVWVPALFGYLSLTTYAENLICQGSSNGLAAATTPEEAALRATLELVERDAFMSAWLSGAASRPIELDGSLDDDLREALAGIAELGGTVELRLLPTSACGTTVLALALGDGESWPGVTLGLAADLDPALALRGAILELCQTGPYLRKLMRSGARDVPADAAAVRELLDHAAYYFAPSRRRNFDRLRAGRDTVVLTPTGGERSLAACTTALAEAGVRVAIVDVTSADVATIPMRVVRAVSPDLQPISFGAGLERVPTERLRKRLQPGHTPLIHPLW